VSKLVTIFCDGSPCSAKVVAAGGDIRSVAKQMKGWTRDRNDLFGQRRLRRDFCPKCTKARRDARSFLARRTR